MKRDEPPRSPESATGSWSPREWLSEIRRLHDAGQHFAAIDLARRALYIFGDSHVLAHLHGLALANAGATQEALERIAHYTDPHVDADLPGAGFVGKELGILEELLGLRGRLHKDVWRTSGDRNELLASRAAYAAGFRATGGTYCGINAASMSTLAGDRPEARRLAQAVLTALRSQPRDDWADATAGEAHLLLEQHEDAIRAYLRTFEKTVSPAESRSMLQQLALLRDHGIPVPDRLIGLFPPPGILAFSGHMIDLPGRESPRFPPDAELETAVATRLDAVLEELNAKVGYCSAAGGSDLLFAEAMLRRGAEVHLVLPFSDTDFVDTSVPHEWLPRFRAAMSHAESVQYLTREEYLVGDDFLFAVTNQILRGKAQLRADRYPDTRPTMVGVADPDAPPIAGGTADFLRSGESGPPTVVIDLKELRERVAPNAKAPPASRDRAPEKDAPGKGGRVLGAMLFADIEHFSRLGDHEMPKFGAFMEKIAEEINGISPRPAFIKTIGDGIFSASADEDGVVQIAQLALALQRATGGADGVQVGDHLLHMRIALHAAPVWKWFDPVSKQEDWFGSHVNWAARLEPVTVRGRIYASENFAYLLTESDHRSRREGRNEEPPWVLEFVGVHALPKDAGEERLFHLRAARE